MVSDGFGERWVRNLLATTAHYADYLGDLDRQTGDGDFGQNLRRAFGQAEAHIEADPPTSYEEWIGAVSRGFLATGGTSGPLFGMLFKQLAACATGPEPSVDDLADGLARGLERVQHYGGAEVGHKTMVDALVPAVDVLASASTAPSPDGTDPLRRAADAASDGARSTAGIAASRGRASYVGEVARGVLDPGAVAVALMLACAAAAGAGESGAVCGDFAIAPRPDGDG